jgi:GMP synthase (glutamine-hydrolysing)
MGGPQNTRRIKNYSYLKDEIDYIKLAISSNKYVLGVCLGAQLISESYGAKTERSPFTEIGVFPLNLTRHGKQDPIFKSFPDTISSCHWHTDMPGVPKDAKILAKSKGCPRQIIRYTPKVYGFQCHLELDLPSIEALISSSPSITEDTYMQTPEKLLLQDYNEINQWLKLFLDGLFSDELSNNS